MVMRIRRFNPFWEMENMLRNLSNMMDFAFEPELKQNNEFTPRVDIWEEDLNYNIEFELPGVKKEDIKLTVNDDKVLVVSGEKKIDSTLENKTCCRSERAYGHFHRAFQLPDDANVNKVKAKFDNGVLSISIAKSEVQQTKEKSIKVL